MAPGERQFKVIGVIYDKEAGNLASVAWRRTGRALTSDRRGHVSAYDFDPDTRRVRRCDRRDVRERLVRGRARLVPEERGAHDAHAALARHAQGLDVERARRARRVARRGGRRRRLLVIYDAATGDDVFRGTVADGSSSTARLEPGRQRCSRSAATTASCT
jgi:hypothetical protein